MRLVDSIAITNIHGPKFTPHAVASDSGAKGPAWSVAAETTLSFVGGVLDFPPAIFGQPVLVIGIGARKGAGTITDSIM